MRGAGPSSGRSGRSGRSETGRTGPGTGRLSFSSILKLTPRPESPRQNIRSRRRFWMALLAVTVLAGCAHQTQQMRVVPVGELEAI